MKWIDFLTPGSLNEAVVLLQEREDALPVAGCTSFHFQHSAAGGVAVLIDRIEALKGIKRVGDVFSMGAATSIAALLAHEEPGWPLKAVAAHLASHQIRAVSTLGGNLAKVFPWADFPVALLALGARLCLQGEQQRELSADDFFASQPAKLFQRGELLTRVDVPAIEAPVGFGYVKKTMKAESFSLATAAACVSRREGRLAEPRVALGAAIAFPVRLKELETELTTLDVQDRTARLAAIRRCAEALPCMVKEGMSKDYIRELAVVTIDDALEAAIAQAGQGGEE